ncbi:MAG: PqqD family protein [Desulfobacterales bacterium]|nr:MAG: PqqD family protein [Desulfobacterales bacterium]
MRVFRTRGSRRSHAKQLHRAEALNLTPVKNVQAVVERLTANEVIINYPTIMRPWIAGWVKRFGGPEGRVQTKKLQLDALGTEVWDLVDGKRSVRQVIQAFAAKHQLQPKEAEVAVTRFIRELGQRGLIGLC